MEERIFQDLDPEARMAEMAKTAVKRECITYRHDFSEEELNEKRKDLADIVTELVDLEEEKKAYQYYEYTSPYGNRSILRNFKKAVQARVDGWNNEIAFCKDHMQINLSDVRVLLVIG